MDDRVLSKREVDGREIRAVRLFRDSGCTYAVRPPSGAWQKQVTAVAASDRGEMVFVMTPTFRTGYDHKHGVSITLVPTFRDYDGRGQEAQCEAVSVDNLGQFGGTQDCDNLKIEISLDHAAALHQALGEVLVDAAYWSRPRI